MPGPNPPYTTVSVDLRHIDGSVDAVNTTLYVQLFQRITLINGDVIWPQKWPFVIVNSLSAGITLPSTDIASCLPANVPLTVTYLDVNGVTNFLGQIIPPTTQDTLALADLLNAGGSTFTVTSRDVNSNPGDFTFVDSKLLLALVVPAAGLQPRALVKAVGIYRWDANSNQSADGTTVIGADPSGKWIVEFAAV